MCECEGVRLSRRSVLEHGSHDADRPSPPDRGDPETPTTETRTIEIPADATHRNRENAIEIHGPARHSAHTARHPEPIVRRDVRRAEVDGEERTTRGGMGGNERVREPAR